jgi:hypothetical protein
LTDLLFKLWLAHDTNRSQVSSCHHSARTKPTAQLHDGIADTFVLLAFFLPEARKYSRSTWFQKSIKPDVAPPLTRDTKRLLFLRSYGA